MEFFQAIPKEYYIYGGICILLIGIILGFTRTITVFRDFADLTKVFMLVLAPVGLLIVFGDKVGSDVTGNMFIVIESGILIWILITTFIDNRNVFKTLLAFITKIPLGVVFAIYLIQIISPGGKSRIQRSKGRGIAGIVLLFFGPVLFGLVRNRVWTFKTERQTDAGKVSH